MKELARIRTDAVDEPVVILHPVLTIAQDPVVQPYQFIGEVMRLLNRANYAHRIRFTIKKLLHTRDNRRRRGPMPAAGVGGDDQDLRYARLRGHLVFGLCAWFSVLWFFVSFVPFCG